ncbi:MAG: OadG family transporter subunit [Rectinema sp.]
MTNPWMIMLLGIITVFVVLFLIILFLLGFPRFVGALKRREHGKPAPLPQIIEVTKKTVLAADGSASQTAGEFSAQEEETLVAVLTAAVAAASSSEIGSFAITQVRQAQAESSGGFNTPVWGRVERLARK